MFLNSFISSNRLRNVQKILKNNLSNADVILCVLGIDGLYNNGCKQLANYLLLDLYSEKEITSSGVDEQLFEDAVILISATDVDVYCNPVNYHSLLSRAGLWTNCHFHCLDKSSFNDSEIGDEFKIRRFISMIEPYKCVGIPFFSTNVNNSGTFNYMEIEKWPLIQAYANEEFSKSGFFTLQKKVVDVSFELSNIYNEFDPVSVKNLIENHLPQFQKQWNNFLDNLTLYSKKNIDNFTEKNVCEPLLFYFKHGSISHASPVNRKPFVLFGENARYENMNNPDMNSSSVVNLSNSSNSCPVAHQIICQAVSPRRPLCCVRTYFTDAALRPHSDINSTPAYDDAVCLDAKLLVLIYQACVVSLRESITTYCSTLSRLKAKQKAFDVFKFECQQNNINLSSSFILNKDVFVYEMEAYDISGQLRVDKLNENQSHFYVKTVRLTINEIPSVKHGSSSLGSVSFGESFINAPIYTNPNQEYRGEHLILTQQIPVHIYLPIYQMDIEANKYADSIFEQQIFGQRLLHNKSVTLVVENVSERFFQGKLCIYESGLVYSHEHNGSIVISNSDIENVQYIDSETENSTVVTLIVQYKHSLSPKLPYFLSTHSKRLLFILQTKDKAQQEFYSKVLPAWKNTQDSLLKRVTLLPENSSLHQIILDATELASTEANRHQNGLPTCSNLNSLPKLQQFLKHFSIVCLGTFSIPDNEFDCMFDTLNKPNLFQKKQKIKITLICGPPGSYKENVSKCFLEDSDNISWHVLNVESSLVTQTAQENQIINHLNVIMDQSAHAEDIQLLIVVPSLFNIQSFARLLTSSEHIYKDFFIIRSVTACVNPAGFFIDGRYSFPNQLEMCKPGWVNSVVLCGTVNDLKADNVAYVKEVIHASNLTVNILSAENGFVSRNSDVELIRSQDFNDSTMTNLRFLSTPNWRESDSLALSSLKVDSHLIPMKRAITKTHFQSMITEIVQQLKDYPFKGNIYHLYGRLKIGDKYQTVIYDVLPRQFFSQTIEEPIDLDTTFFIFTGCDLKHSALLSLVEKSCSEKNLLSKFKTREDITDKEYAKIQNENRLNHLPEGWFYNGNTYVSIEGEKSLTHPYIEEFVSQYLNKENKKFDM